MISGARTMLNLKNVFPLAAIKYIRSAKIGLFHSREVSLVETGNELRGKSNLRSG